MVVESGANRMETIFQVWGKQLQPLTRPVEDGLNTESLTTVSCRLVGNRAAAFPPYLQAKQLTDVLMGPSIMAARIVNMRFK